MVLVLKALQNDYTTFDGFQYPTEANTVVTAPDWNADPNHTSGGGGLYGFKNGVGEDKYIDMILRWTDQGNNTTGNFEWMVLDVNEQDIIDVGGAIRFKEGRVVFRSDKRKAFIRPYISMFSNFILAKYVEKQAEPKIDIPIMGLNVSFNKGGGNTDVWEATYYDYFAGGEVDATYTFSQKEFIFGQNTTLRGGLHGSYDVNGKKFTVGHRSKVSIHANNTKIITGEFCDVKCGLAFFGFGITASVDRFSSIVTEKDCVVTASDFCNIEDRGLSRQREVEEFGRNAVRVTCGDYCTVELNIYSEVVARDRCLINVQSNCKVECGVGCIVNVLGNSLKTSPPSRGPTKVKGKKGTIVTYAPDRLNGGNVYQWVVGLGGGAIVEDRFYHVNDFGQVIDEFGIIVPPQDYNYTSGGGSPGVNLKDAVGPRSFFYNLDRENSAGYDIEDLDIKDRLTDNWRSFYKGFGPP